MKIKEISFKLKVENNHENSTFCSILMPDYHIKSNRYRNLKHLSKIEILILMIGCIFRFANCDYFCKIQNAPRNYYWNPLFNCSNNFSNFNPIEKLIYSCSKYISFKYKKIIFNSIDTGTHRSDKIITRPQSFFLIHHRFFVQKMHYNRENQLLFTNKVYSGAKKNDNDPEILNKIKLLIAQSKQIFYPSRNYPLSLTELLALRKYMENLQLEDLGYTPQTLRDETQKKGINSPHVITVYEGDEFHIVAFVLPKGCYLNFHDHIGMCVVAKLLHGKVRLRVLHSDDIYPCHINQFKFKTMPDYGLNQNNISLITNDDVKFFEMGNNHLRNIKNNMFEISDNTNDFDGKSQLSTSSDNESYKNIGSLCSCGRPATMTTSKSVFECTNMYGHYLKTRDAKFFDSIKVGVTFDDILSSLEVPKKNSSCSMTNSNRTLGSNDGNIEKILSENGISTEKPNKDNLRKCNVASKLDYIQSLRNEKINILNQIIFPNDRYCTTWLVLPSFSNIHLVASIDDYSVILDVISPPYRTSYRERPCRYFNQIQSDSSKSLLNLTEKISRNEVFHMKPTLESNIDYFGDLPFLAVPVNNNKFGTSESDEIA